MRTFGKRRNVIVIVLGLIMFIFMGMAVFGEEVVDDLMVNDRQTVLVINAYHQGFGWTDSQTDAILKSFTEYDGNVIVSVEYLDWKRYPHSENLERQRSYMEYKYVDKDIDLVIATDDIGMQFAIDHREGLFPGAQIVFTGVFESSALERMKGVKNITGVYERIDMVGTVEVMKAANKSLDKIYILSDSSYSGKAVSKEAKRAIKEVDKSIEIEDLVGMSYKEIFSLLGGAKGNSGIIMGAFMVDSLGESIPVELFTKELSENVDLPIYSPYEFLLGHGIVGGSILGGNVQGELAADLGKEILGGAMAEELPIIVDNGAYYGFDYEQMAQHNVLMSQIPEESQLINKPASIYDLYKEAIISILGAMIFMVAFIVILAINVTLRKGVQEALEKEHKRALETNAALAESEEQLKKQNVALIAQQERINYLAYNDHLTDVPNRLQIKNYSSLLIEQSRLKASKMILVFIDLDNFNYVNTAHGHVVGDLMLKELAKRFKDYLNGQGVIGRIGGDEFVCLKGVEVDYDVSGFITGLMSVFDQPIKAKNREVNASASLGYALYPDDGNSYDELLIRADMAMYKMKDKGKSQASRFDLAMNDEMTQKINLTNALKKALDNDEFYMVYQPQYDLQSGKVIGYESLLRWKSGTLGLVGPDIFIPIAESTGDIVDIGYFVIESSIKFAKKLVAIGRPAKVAVNISVIQLLRSEFVTEVRRSLMTHELDPAFLEFEITESVLIESFEVVRQQLLDIQQMGIKIALDDFGTGYSSLTYLKKLPISTLKIDKLFIDDIIHEGQGHFFTASIIDIAKQLGYGVVAEGVEEESQAAYLKEAGCEYVQGYLYSKPMCEEDALCSLDLVEMTS